MRNVMLAGALVALLVPVAAAQAQNAAPAAPDQPATQAPAPMPPAVPSGPGGGWMRGPMPWHGWMEHRRPGMAMMMMHTKAAFFRFQRGNASVTVKCAEDEPTQACANAASTLLDKIRQGEPTH